MSSRVKLVLVGQKAADHASRIQALVGVPITQRVRNLAQPASEQADLVCLVCVVNDPSFAYQSGSDPSWNKFPLFQLGTEGSAGGAPPGHSRSVDLRTCIVYGGLEPSSSEPLTTSLLHGAIKKHLELRVAYGKQLQDVERLRGMQQKAGVRTPAQLLSLSLSTSGDAQWKEMHELATQIATNAIAAQEKLTVHG